MYSGNKTGHFSCANANSNYSTVWEKSYEILLHISSSTKSALLCNCRGKGLKNITDLSKKWPFILLNWSLIKQCRGHEKATLPILLHCGIHWHLAELRKLENFFNILLTVKWTCGKHSNLLIFGAPEEKGHLALYFVMMNIESPDLTVNKLEVFEWRMQVLFLKYGGRWICTCVIQMM